MMAFCLPLPQGGPSSSSSSSSSFSPSSTLAAIATEEHLVAAQRDVEYLKEALRMKEVAYEDLERDCRYHTIKCGELTDVLDACCRGGDWPQQRQQQQKGVGEKEDERNVRDVLRAKAEQNAELAMQVHALKETVDTSAKSMDAMRKELEAAAAVNSALTEEKRTHQRAMVQINGLVRTLQRVEVSVDIPSEWINNQWLGRDSGGDNNSIQLVTRKIIAIEADRQRLLREGRSVQEEHDAKDARIVMLERKARATERDHSDALEEISSLRRELDVRAGKIGALEELFQNINASRTIDGTDGAGGGGTADAAQHPKQRNRDGDNGGHRRRPHPTDIPRNVECDDRTVSVMEVDEDDSVEISSQANGTTELVLTTSIASQMPDIVTDDEGGQSVDRHHPHDDDDESTAATVRAELVMLKDRYRSLQEDRDASKLAVASLEQEVTSCQQRALASEKKAELREGLLKDVIQQYKALQRDHSQCTDQLGRLKHKVRTIKELGQYQHQRSPQHHAKGHPPAGVGAAGKDVPSGSPPRPQAVEEAGTFDMTEPSSGPEEDEDSYFGLEIQVDGRETMLTEDYQRLEGECDRLRHEFETAVDRIAALEGELSQARAQILDGLRARAHQAHSIAVLENEKAGLQDRLDDQSRRLKETASSQEEVSTQHRDALRMAELQLEQARGKQKQREQDLWDVIEQYKQLAEKNESTKEQMHNVEQELRLTHKVKIQRRDLVYEYRRLERAMEDAMTTVEELEKDLHRAKSDAARNKEESKCVRKRLAGCHFHYRQLQQEYDTCLKERDDLERRNATALRHEALRRVQEESWQRKVEDLREKGRVAEDGVGRLTKENSELHTYCKELLALASKSVEAM